jgi:hypothetical protein
MRGLCEIDDNTVAIVFECLSFSSTETRERGEV